jgi:hypothetical protein
MIEWIRVKIKGGGKGGLVEMIEWMRGKIKGQDVREG